MESNADNETHFGSSCPQCGYDTRGVTSSRVCPECGLDLQDWPASDASRRAASRSSAGLGLAAIGMVSISCCTGVTLPRSKPDVPTAGAGTALPFVLHAVILVLGGWVAIRAIRFGGLFAQIAGTLAALVTSLILVMHVSNWFDAVRS
jgi:hypothetical protein